MSLVQGVNMGGVIYAFLYHESHDDDFGTNRYDSHDSTLADVNELNMQVLGLRAPVQIQRLHGLRDACI